MAVNKENLKGRASFSVEVSGPFACFTRPEFKTERVSYDVITPSAACGLLKHIYWHPGIEYVIDRIYVLSPIRHLSMRRNEVKEKLDSGKIVAAMTKGKSSTFINEHTQRNMVMLLDVHYIIDAHMRITKQAFEDKDMTLNKAMGTFLRRLNNGHSYKDLCLGCRELEAYVSPVTSPYVCPSELIGKIKLGRMLYDIDYSSNPVRPRFFDATLVNGVLDVPGFWSEEVYYVS